MRVAWTGALLFGAAVSASASAHAADPAPAATPINVDVHGELGPPVGKRDPSGASQVIRGERLDAPGATAADVLAEVPGVQVSRTGSAADLATASIRGATSAETPVYLAGVRINDDVTGTADLSLVPLWMIQRVEVYRSGAPEDADRMGIGGAIFFEPKLPRGPRVGAGLGVGSFGERSGWVAGSLGDARAGAMIGARVQRADNDYPYLDDRGTTFDKRDDRVRLRPNADYTLYDLWSIGRFRVGRGTITAIASGLAREQGTSGLGVVPAEAARTSVQRWLGAVSSTTPCAAGDRCLVDLVSSIVLTRNVLRDPEGELGLGAPLVASSGARIGERGRVRYRFGDTVTLGLGASQEMEQLGVDEGGATGAASAATGHGEAGASIPAPLVRARRGTTRGTASILFAATPAVELNALAALEHHATAAVLSGATSGDASVVEPTARAGVRFRVLEGLDLLANGGRYTRVPTLGELYGTSAIVRGNPGLAPETGYSADVGARVGRALRHVQLQAQLFAFARVATDLVGYRISSLGVVRPYNVARARVLGVELSAGATLFDHARLGLALTSLDPRDTSPDRALASDLLPFQARLVVAPELQIHGALPAIGLDRASIGARLGYRASRVADPAGLIVLPAQAPLDVELALLFAQSRVGLRLVVADVLDAPLYDVVGMPLPGRSFHGSTELWW